MQTLVKCSIISKQCKPWRNAALCCISFVSSLFAKGTRRPQTRKLVCKYRCLSRHRVDRYWFGTIRNPNEPSFSIRQYQLIVYHWLTVSFIFSSVCHLKRPYWLRLNSPCLITFIYIQHETILNTYVNFTLNSIFRSEKSCTLISTAKSLFHHFVPVDSFQILCLLLETLRGKRDIKKVVKRSWYCVLQLF